MRENEELTNAWSHPVLGGAERDETDTRPGEVGDYVLTAVPDEPFGIGAKVGEAVEGPMELVEELQGFCESLLLLLRSQTVECEVLRERLRWTERKLETSENIAEDLYQFFSKTARRVASDKQESEAFATAQSLRRVAREDGRAQG